MNHIKDEIDKNDDESLKRIKNKSMKNEKNKKGEKFDKEKSKDFFNEEKDEINEKSKPIIKSKNIKNKKNSETVTDDLNEKSLLNFKRLNKNVKTKKKQNKNVIQNIKNNKHIKNELKIPLSTMKKIEEPSRVNNIEQHNNFCLSDFIFTNEKTKKTEITEIIEKIGIRKITKLLMREIEFYLLKKFNLFLL